MWSSQELAIPDVGPVPFSERILRQVLTVIMVPAVLPLIAIGWVMGQHRAA